MMVSAEGWITFCVATVMHLRIRVVIKLSQVTLRVNMLERVPHFSASLIYLIKHIYLHLTLKRGGGIAPMATPLQLLSTV